MKIFYSWLCILLISFAAFSPFPEIFIQAHKEANKPFSFCPVYEAQADFHISLLGRLVIFILLLPPQITQVSPDLQFQSLFSVLGCSLKMWKCIWIFQENFGDRPPAAPTPRSSLAGTKTGSPSKPSHSAVVVFFGGGGALAAISQLSDVIGRRPLVDLRPSHTHAGFTDPVSGMRGLWQPI